MLGPQRGAATPRFLLAILLGAGGEQCGEETKETPGELGVSRHPREDAAVV